ncbi:methionyl-tRNA formyltransferase [Labrys miyagiensis]|uniref:Methionyl-tRNA formyltransferase n=1 Tax=Labrys miyagiensis TaxID=346912 RepID=A0ABQ6CTI4_9HYPH|nr:methionyl-tRNA formyltransferase [Labrys miyagiensis]GLS23070.1 methionyl-tRNA formyltransferase [Labrys miyagiensis]
MRVVFMGTPDFARPVLTEILSQGHEVVAAFTRPPATAGRGMALAPSPVHKLAEGFGIPVFTPKSFRDEETLSTFRALDADVAVVVAYGLILPKAALEAPVEGCLNLHASLLPRWRGAAPIQRAIMAGDAKTGVMVMRMEEGLDTGPVALADSVEIGPDMTACELHDRLAPLGADLMARALGALSRGTLTFTPQVAEGVTYARKIEKAEARIDWSRPAEEVHHLICGLSPFPGAWFEADWGQGQQRVKVLRSQLAEGYGVAGTVLDDELTVACGGGAVRLIQVQRAGKTPMEAEVFLKGAAVVRGTRL